MGEVTAEQSAAEASVPGAPEAQSPPAGESEGPRPEDETEWDLIQSPQDEDPRLPRLREAFESGKISREAYEANLKRFAKRP